MIRWLLFCYFSVLQLIAVSQINAFSWSEPIKNSGQITQLISLNKKQFVSVKTSKSQLFPATIATKYQDGKVSVTKKMTPNFGQKLFNLVTFVSFQERLTGIYTDKSNGETIVYAVQFDDFLEPMNEPVALLTIAENNLYKGAPIVRIEQSDNKEFLAVEAFLTAKKNGYDYLQYKVFDKLYSDKQLNDFEFSTTSNKTIYRSSKVGNDGSFYFTYLVYNAPVSSAVNEKIAVEKSVVVFCKNGKTNMFEQQMDNKRIELFDCIQRDSFLLVTGTVGEDFSAGVKGVVYLRINTNTNTIEKVMFSDFPAETLEEEQQKNRRIASENKEFSANTKNELYHYVLRELIPLNDGSLIVVAEQVFVVYQHFSDGRGMTQTLKHFNFNDVLVYRLAVKDGTIEWLTKVTKEQRSTNDFGYFSSLNVVASEHAVDLYFIDDVSYYSDLGEYTAEKSQRSVFLPIAKKHACLAQTNIAFNSGKQLRTISCYALESDGIIVPKLSVSDKKEKMLLFLSEGRDETIGVKNY